MRTRLVLVWLSLLLPLVACGGPGDPESRVLAVSIAEGDQALLVGTSTQLTARVDVEGSASRAVTWGSSDIAVASVDDDGSVTGEGVGEAVITATSTVDATKSDGVTITVMPPSAPASVDARPSAGSVQVTWQLVDGVERYALHRGSTSEDVTFLHEVEVDVGSDLGAYQDWQVEQGQSYVYGVAAIVAGTPSQLKLSAAATPLPTITVADTREAVTDEAGRARIEYEHYQLDVVASERESGDGVPAITVHAIAMTNGLLVLASPNDEDYLPAMDFIRYDAFGTTESMGVERRVAVSTMFLILAVGAAGVALYELITDPPYFEEIILDDGTKLECIVGDINDVLAIMGLVTAGTTTAGYLKVKGAAATVRGVTAIQMGFTKKHLTNEIAKSSLIKTLDALTGILSQKRRICQFSVGNRITGSTTRLPYAIIEVDESEYSAPVQDWTKFGASIGTADFGGASPGTVITYWTNLDEPGTHHDMSLVVIGPEGWNAGSVFVLDRSITDGYVSWTWLGGLLPMSGTYSFLLNAPDGAVYSDTITVDAAARHPRPDAITVHEALTDRVEASWAIVPGSTYYTIDILGPDDSGFFPTARRSSVAPAVTFTGLALEAGTDYRLRVTSVTAATGLQTDATSLNVQHNIGVRLTPFTLLATSTQTSALEAELIHGYGAGGSSND